MILVTGGTGFIGKALVRHLTEAGYPVRLLIRPSRHSPQLPQGVPVEVAVSSLTDRRGLRSAMVGVDVVYHLAGAERRGPGAQSDGGGHPRHPGDLPRSLPLWASNAPFMSATWVLIAPPLILPLKLRQ